MNILHLHTFLNHTCGITRSIATIAANANASRHIVYALGGDAVSSLRARGLDVRIAESPHRLMFLKRINEIREICEEQDISVCHAHHRYFDLLLHLWSYGGQKKVTSVHSIVKGKKFLSYKSGTLIAVGESVKMHLVSYFGIEQARIEVINNAVQPELYNITISKEELRRAYNIPQDDFVFLFAGRFDLEKAVDILISAFIKVTNKNAGVTFVAIGAGPEEERMKQAAIGSDKIIILTPQKNIADWYNLTGAVVLPSRVDPFPLVMLEAGLFALPIIGSEVNGIAEFIADGKNGLLIPADNEAALIDAVEKIVHSPALQLLLGNALREKVLSEYTIKPYIKKLEQLYSRL